MGYNLLINGVHWGYNALTNLLLTSWDIQVVVHLPYTANNQGSQLVGHCSVFASRHKQSEVNSILKLLGSLPPHFFRKNMLKSVNIYIIIFDTTTQIGMFRTPEPKIDIFCKVEYLGFRTLKFFGDPPQNNKSFLFFFTSFGKLQYIYI